MPRRPKELPWSCPQCGYTPRAHQTRSNGTYMYDLRDAARLCAKAAAPDSDVTLHCPHIAEISDRALRFR
ncbi:MAG: hypothetical protein JWQ36_182 [Enterovirga sp.]|nr:hypothetical protein [Enterovirga sp.]